MTNAERIAESGEALRVLLTTYLEHHEDKYKYRLLKYNTGLQKPQKDGFLKGERSLTYRKGKEAAEFLKTKGY